LSDSRDTNEDAQEVLEIPEMPTTPPVAATGGSMGEQEPEAESPRKTQPWRELLKTKDGWRSILYDPDPNAGIAVDVDCFECGHGRPQQVACSPDRKECEMCSEISPTKKWAIIFALLKYLEFYLVTD